MSNSVRPHPWDSPAKNTGVGCHFRLQCIKVKSESEVAQSCPTLRDPMDCSLPGSSVHGIFQARVLEWGAIAVSSPSIYPLLKYSFFPGTTPNSWKQQKHTMESEKEVRVLLCPFPAEWHWASHFASLSLGFPICN